jgi:formylglycine-generating enzyme required for sulfatase activity
MTIPAAVLFFALFASSAADTLIQNDGLTVSGKFLGMTRDGVRFRVNDREMTYPRSEVKEIAFSGPRTPPSGKRSLIRLGQTIEEVGALLGPPPTLFDFGAKKIYLYLDPPLKIVFRDGKVREIPVGAETPVATIPAPNPPDRQRDPDPEPAPPVRNSPPAVPNRSSNPGISPGARGGVILTPLDPALTEDKLISNNSNRAANIIFFNQSNNPLDVYWIGYQGQRVKYASGVSVGGNFQIPTYLTHPFLIVASGTGGTADKDTGKRLAGFMAITPNPQRDPAIYDVAIITDSPLTATPPSPQPRNEDYGNYPPKLRHLDPLEPTAHAPENRPPVVEALRPPPIVNPKDGLTYVWIPPGSFTMGCSPGDTKCYETENPAHQVTIPAGFRIGQTTVTQEAYQRVTGKNPSFHKGAKLPVDSVSWIQAQRYCQALGMRLPTEAEWEFAARAGSNASRYGELDEIAWHSGNSRGQPHDVMQKKPNAWGLYDTLGNIFQWTADFYTKNYSQARAFTPNATGKDSRVTRGGFYGLTSDFIRVSYRGSGGEDYQSITIGFRCAGN